MFAHIYTMRLKCIMKDRQVIFWTLFFPIILGTLFHFAFSNLGSQYKFQEFNIAVVSNIHLGSGTAFKSTLDSVSGSKKDALFNVTYCGRQKADTLLNNSKIDGYVYYDGEIKMAVKQSDLNQTILKAFLDEYKQKSAAIETIIKKNPMGAAAAVAELSKDVSYLKQIPLSGSKSNADVFVNYFYALISMACLYGGFFGMREVHAIQANQSAQGARVNMAPVHKLKVFFASICAATTAQLACVYILLAYLGLVLGVDFGGKVPYIALAGLVSCFAGVSFGAFIAACVKGSEMLKTAIVISSTMVLSFLSGLMVDNVKYVIEKNAPVVAFLNPANAITDTFYSLYYYDTYTRFFQNIAILVAFSAVFYFGVFLVMRRQKYESI
jgi:ABC-2 type transport system permease protein